MVVLGASVCGMIDRWFRGFIWFKCDKVLSVNC